MSNRSQELPYPLDASRVLRGVCDGEVLLDSKLKISGKSGEVEQRRCGSEQWHCLRNRLLEISKVPVKWDSLGFVLSSW